MKKMKTCFVAMVLVAGCCGAASADLLQGFETDTGDWYFYDGGVQSGRVASGGGLLGVASAGGSYHAELANVNSSYSAGYGMGGYSFFGGPSTVYPGPFYQAVDVYLDPTWSGGGFWIDMSPRDIDGTGLYAAEANFRLTADGSAVAVQAINGPVLTSITTAGWYTFEIAWSKGATPTDLINIDLTVYDDAGTALGTDTRLAEFPQGSHAGESQYLGGNGYVWFTVWKDGFAGDVLAIDNVRCGVVPVPGAVLLGLLGLGAAGMKLRKRA